MNLISNFSLCNQYGMLDPGRPFQPFGIQPERGSYLLVGSPEFLTQRPESVTLRINWQALPSTLDFARYYESYGIPIGNSSFRVSASFLHGAQWHPLNLPEPSLFREVEGRLSLVSEFVLEPLKYDQDTAERFLRLELTEPAFGFGAGLYANVLSSVVLKNAASAVNALSAPDALPGANTPVPNPPFTPIAAGISIFLGSANQLPISDAGAVLAWPFLNTLFERAGLIDADRHLNQQRALSLLLYLTWGSTYQEHRASPVLKILSGMPPETESPALPLTDEEKNLCDGLLSALIAQWEIVKNTSNEGIRGTFLQRNGRLVKEEDRYVLTVEGKSFDLLLDRLPWSISRVKTPWMDRALLVKWR